MSTGVFYLDEDQQQRERDSSPSPSPKPSPILRPDGRSSTPTISTTPPTLQIPQSIQPSLLIPQPQPFTRKHQTTFAATPSFPSPLAQAITVPINDNSSSSSLSSDEEDESKPLGNNSPQLSGAELTPRKTGEPFPRPRTASPTSRQSSPSSSQRSTSRPPSPQRAQVLTPGALLMRTRQTSTTSHLSGSVPASPVVARESPPRSVPTPTKRESPTHAGPRRFDTITRSDISAASPSRRRGSSGSNASLSVPYSVTGSASSQHAFGSPELGPERGDTSSRRGSIGGSPVRESKDGSGNSLGLGLSGGWDSSGLLGGSLRDKGKGKEGMGPPSPRRERERTVPASIAVASPPRQRRPSEFLNPSLADARKMPIMGGARSGAVASLSTSASMISPLNPLPSPWSDSGSSDHSPLSPPTNQKHDSTSGSSAGAIRLNRVPTSVRLAAELIKNNDKAQATAAGTSPPSGQSSTSTASVPTPNPSPAATPGHMPPPNTGSLSGSFSLTPAAGRIATSTPMDIGKGRPTLSVPGSPRNITPEKASVSPTTGPVTVGSLESVKSQSSATLAPPSAFKQPLPPTLPRHRPSLPADAPATPETFAPTQRTHRYRTSMHEASFNRDFLDPLSKWSSPQEVDEVNTTTVQPKAGPSKSGGYGLGLNMQPQSALLAAPNTTLGLGMVPQVKPRVRSTTSKEIQMDLAGVGSGMGDAASHASMIMQSRQAKLQRWRPNSAGSQAGLRGQQPLPPAFNRSTTTGAPAMLALPRADRQAQWDLPKNPSPTSALSSPGEDLPPFPSSLDRVDLTRATSISPETLRPGLSDRSNGPSPIRANAGPSRFSPLPNMPLGGVGMEKQGSASGSVGGIEWVDWYDCYKRYKDAKIKAEADAAKVGQNVLGLAESSREVSAVNSKNTSPIAEEHEEPDEGSRREQIREVDLNPSYDTGSAIDLTPTTSRDDFGSLTTGHGGLRKRSMSIRSTLSAIDPSRSPNQKRMSIFERPRQTSGSSVRTDASGSFSMGGGGKKKKNLVTKMEGWWNAVKSNFIPESQHAPSRPSNLGNYVSPRIPSAPTSRRGSAMSPVTTAHTALLVPEPTRRNSGHSLRQATSHAELRSRNKQSEAHHLQEAASIIGSTSADIATLSRKSELGMISPTTDSAVPTPSADDLPQPSIGLEARRRQPGLRLELQSNVMTRPSSRRAATTSDSGSMNTRAGQTSAPLNQPPGHSSRSSSYGQSLLGPGLTPGVPRWDQTPSPLYSLSAEDRAAREERPVAPGTDITIASVRRHIKHRLTAAKEACDATLSKTIDAMTKFAEEQKREEEDPSDYFDVVSDSPLVDGDDSEMEGGDDTERSRSRHVSRSRPASRQPSMSRGANSSPTKRTAMLPSSPSRVRRRPSAIPRGFAGRGRDYIARNLSLSLDQSSQIGHSVPSSRSTSRSRSPMPPRGSFGPTGEEMEDDRRFLSALQDLIVIATDVLDTTVSSLSSKSTYCTQTIQKLQKVGQHWDDHDEWPGRSWYVDILMAVANLSRVLDWWEAEKGFWNFDEEDENEPLLFVMKPGKEESRFDQEFKAALPESRSSPAIQTLALPSSDGPLSAVSLELPSPNTSGGGGTAKPPNVATLGSPSGHADNLRFLADHAKSVNIVMELGLHGEDVEYVNDAILEVTGRDPDDVLNRPITDLLAPADASVFAEATQKLLEDDNNTVQLRFRFEVHELLDDDSDRQPGPVYVELEGVGMLMREKDKASHTMWVLKPVTATRGDAISDAAFPHEGRISTENILCRICEREIVTWFFEKHNETCDAVHRLEAEISASNECLHDLRQTVVGLATEIEGTAPGQAAQYQGVLFFTLPDSLATDLEVLPTGPQGVEIRKVTTDHLQDVIQVLTIAQQVETPSVQEDEADLPFNVQMYLSRESEEKLNRLMKWQRPQTSDRALGLLFNHVEDQLRRKQKAIARMQSTIRYSEKTRHEWEDKVNHMLAEREDGSASDSGSDGVDGTTSPVDVGENVETSPPGHRKIAPQARLPITQGHPQRPSTAHSDNAGSSFTVPPTPMPPATPSLVIPAPSPSARLPEPMIAQTAPLPGTSHSLRAQQALRLESPSLSPLLQPIDRTAGHQRRVSSSRAMRDGPLSPRIPSAALPSRTAATSIKDFEIIKPISRGAFGSVYLAKKVTTGDYFAIKALKKSDMIAKNQITNVKAERTILMNQASSPYVAKLFFSFQSKEYLYLVMEYLNGGDCAALVKTLGGLSEEWARNYIAEVVLGLEYLHARNIVHRDIKPDNLLIDARGHLKLTDFGLSRIGLLNRQVGGPRPAFLRGTSLRGTVNRGPHRPSNSRNESNSSADSPLMSPDLLSGPALSNLSQSYFNQLNDATSADESSGSESASAMPRYARHQSFTTRMSSEANTPSISGGREPPRFVGTPDYLAPESILGIGTDDKSVDWWALGVVLYEFIFGIPPFHAESPEKVFDNVISRRIDWHEEEMEISVEAHDFMNRLMCSDPNLRLGARGADEVKKHAFFTGIDWDTIATTEASFVPEVTDPESTDYFDSRGAAHGFHDEEEIPQVTKAADDLSPTTNPAVIQSMSAIADDISSQDDFGTFDFKNLPVLKQANDDVIRKLRTDSMAPINQTLEGAPNMSRRPRSLSNKLRGRAKRKPADLHSNNGPPSPSDSTSSAASTPSRGSAVPPSTPGSLPSLPQHFRRPSELNALDRVKSSDEADILRRASAPSRVRAGSGSSVSDRSTSMEMWRQRRQASLNTEIPSMGPGSAAGSSGSGGMLGTLEDDEEHHALSDRSLDVLIAEDNPISQKILETLLTRMGCRCICVEDGPQALAATMGSIRFDVIICDIHMPVVSGEQVARMIRSTNNHNQNTPIIAATSYEQHRSITEEGTLFSAVLAKPVTRADLTKCLAKLGFILSSTGTSTTATTTTHSIPALETTA